MALIIPDDHIFSLLDTNGNGTGTTNAIGDYSSVVTDFFLAPSTSTEVLVINRMLVYVEDSGALDSDLYGNGINLVNGIDIFKESDNQRVTEFLSGTKLKRNLEWEKFCSEVKFSSVGTERNYVKLLWDFTVTGRPVKLDGNTNDKLIVRLNDDFSGLIEHTFLVQGHIK